jgi:hypothetical protein
VIPEAENPVPVTVIELIVTGAFPVDVSVNVCVDFVFTFTLPKLRDGALALRVAVEPVSCSAKVWAVPFALAVNVTACDVLTAVIVAANPAVLAPAATVTDAGTVTAVLLLASPTANPPLAAATFSVTEQLSVAAPVTELLLQVSPVSTGMPVPVRLTTVEPPEVELLVSVSEPVSAPAAVGSNPTVNVAV